MCGARLSYILLPSLCAVQVSQIQLCPLVGSLCCLWRARLSYLLLLSLCALWRARLSYLLLLSLCALWSVSVTQYFLLSLVVVHKVQGRLTLVLSPPVLYILCIV